MPVATIQKELRKGGFSTWTFVKGEDGACFARKTTGRTIRCSDIEDMRRLYKAMLGYGYRPTYA